MSLESRYIVYIVLSHICRIKTSNLIFPWVWEMLQVLKRGRCGPQKQRMHHWSCMDCTEKLDTALGICISRHTRAHYYRKKKDRYLMHCPELDRQGNKLPPLTVRRFPVLQGHYILPNSSRIQFGMWYSRHQSPSGKEVRAFLHERSLQIISPSNHRQRHLKGKNQLG